MASCAFTESTVESAALGWVEGGPWRDVQKADPELCLTGADQPGPTRRGTPSPRPRSDAAPSLSGAIRRCLNGSPSPIQAPRDRGGPRVKAVIRRSGSPPWRRGLRAAPRFTITRDGKRTVQHGRCSSTPQSAGLWQGSDRPLAGWPASRSATSARQGPGGGARQPHVFPPPPLSGRPAPRARPVANLETAGNSRAAFPDIRDLDRWPSMHVWGGKSSGLRRRDCCKSPMDLPTSRATRWPRRGAPCGGPHTTG